MASLIQPFNPDTPNQVVELATCTTEDTLPNHVKGQVQWFKNQEGQPPGYYLYSHKSGQFHAVEFLNNYWHCTYTYTGTTYTSLEDRIIPYTEGTGYWHITEPQHPGHATYAHHLQRALGTVRTPSPRAVPLPPSRRDTPPLQVETQT